MGKNFDPNLVIEYGSWFECIEMFKLSEVLLTQKINERVDNHFNQLISVGIKNLDRKVVKVNALQTMQLEKSRNEARLSFLKRNNVLGAFDNLIPLGEIHDRIVAGIIDKLKKLD